MTDLLLLTKRRHHLFQEAVGEGATGIVNPAGSDGFNPVVLDSAWWYGRDIGEFPAPLHIMVPEEDPGKRVELWNRVKATP